MSTDLTKEQVSALAELSGLGLEDISHASTQIKNTRLDNNTGVITIAGTEIILADSKTPVKIIPVHTHERWQLVTPDGSAVLRQDLIHEKNHNIALQDNENVMVKDRNSIEQPAVRTKSRTIAMIVQDREFDGPIFLSLRRQKLWSAQSTILSKWVENKAKKIPIFGQAFLLSSEQKTNKKNQKYYVYKFVPAENITDMDRLMKLAGLYREIQHSQDKFLQQSDDESGTASE